MSFILACVNKKRLDLLYKSSLVLPGSRALHSTNDIALKLFTIIAGACPYDIYLFCVLDKFDILNFICIMKRTKVLFYWQKSGKKSEIGALCTFQFYIFWRFSFSFYYKLYILETFEHLPFYQKWCDRTYPNAIFSTEFYETLMICVKTMPDKH